VGLVRFDAAASSYGVDAENGMPTFKYTLTRGNETRTTELRRSNPQGWLVEAVTATFPDVASQREYRLPRLEPVAGMKQTWRAVLVAKPSDIQIHVTQTYPRLTS
jgi:hypothetical protein